jgi:hypothetical protein
MGIPAQAFVEINPTVLAPGRLFLFRGYWALRLAVDEAHQAFVMLEGERVGAVLQTASGMAKTIAIAEPFSWFPLIAMDNKPAILDDPKGSLAITATGPVVVGLDARNDWDPTYLAIASSGRAEEAQEPYRPLCFAKWSVEVCHQDQPLKSLGTLAEIDRRKKV